MVKVGVVPSAMPAAEPAVEADTFVRNILFIAMFLLTWVTLQPFQSLADPPKTITESGDIVNQVGFSVIFLLLAAWTYFHDPRRLLLLVRPLMLATLAWCLLCVVTSWAPLVSARRLTFTVMVLGMAGMVLLLPKNLRHFADLIGATVLIVLIVSYLGLIFAPQLSIHQATDFLEPEHAGEWRGVFNHKNTAGVMMVLFIFVGVLIARVRNFAFGALIVGLSLVFLAFSGAKTALGIFPLTLVLSAIVTRMHSRVLAVVLVVGVLAVLNLCTIGSIYFEPVSNLIDAILPDPTFTGRTQLWQFGVEHVLQHPILGYGFYAFWGTQQIVYGLGENQAWVNSASDAHNTYLNLALTIGLPGLVLSVAWIVAMPIVDFFRRTAAGAPPTPLQVFFLRVCLFAIYSSCFENSFFQQLDSAWFLFITSTFGLRYVAVGRLTI